MWASETVKVYSGDKVTTETNGFKWRLRINGSVKDEGIIIVIGKIVLTGYLSNGDCLMATIIGFPLGFSETWRVNGVKISRDNFL